jgi:hypothetical protein
MDGLIEPPLAPPEFPASVESDEYSVRLDADPLGEEVR